MPTLREQEPALEITAADECRELVADERRQHGAVLVETLEKPRQVLVRLTVGPLLRHLHADG